jgi:hypothetical protein
VFAGTDSSMKNFDQQFEKKVSVITFLKSAADMSKESDP